MSQPRDAYLVDGVRTAIGAFAGSLAHTRPDDLAAHVLARLLERYPAFDRERVADVILGCANQAGEDNRNVARMALLLAGCLSRCRDRRSTVCAPPGSPPSRPRRPALGSMMAMSSSRAVWRA